VIGNPLNNDIAKIIHDGRNAINKVSNVKFRGDPFGYVTSLTKIETLVKKTKDVATKKIIESVMRSVL
jgi:hypothetical protein